MKRLLYILPLLLLLLSAGGIFILSQIDTDLLRTHLADMVQDATGKPLEMAAAPKVSFFPLGLTFGAARWGANDGKPATEELSVSVKGGSVHLELLPLLSGRVVIDEIRLDNPIVTLRPKQKGAPPLAAPKPGAPRSDTAAPETAPLPPIELTRLSIVNGTLDMQTENDMTVLAEGFNVSITNLRPGAEAIVKSDMSLRLVNPDLAGNLALATKARLRGSLLELRQTSLTATPLQGPVPSAVGPVQMLLDGTYDLSTGQAELPTLQLTLNGLKAAFSGAGHPASASLEGSLSLDAAPRTLATLCGAEAPAGNKDTLKLETRLSLEGGRLRLTALKGALDDTPLRGELVLGWHEALFVRGSLEAGDVSLDAWLNGDAPVDPHATTSAAAPVPGRNGAGSQMSAAKSGTPATPDAPQKISALPTVDVNLKIASLTITTLRFVGVQARIMGDGGRYTCDPLIFSLNTGGTVAAVVGADIDAQRYTLAGKAADVALGPLFQALRGTRPLDADAFLEAHLSCTGGTMQALKSSLSGKGRLSLRDIVLNGISVLPQGVPGLPKGGATPTRFNVLQAPFTAKSGIVSISPLTLTSPALTAKGKVTIRLPQDSLDCTADIHLPGITVPVVVSGPFSHLSYGLDPRRTLETLLKVPGGVLQPGKVGKSSGSYNPVRDLDNVVRGLFKR